MVERCLIGAETDERLDIQPGHGSLAVRGKAIWVEPKLKLILANLSWAPAKGRLTIVV